MSKASLEERVAALEADVARLKGGVERPDVEMAPWWKKFQGAFAADPLFEEAMRFGREWRESQRPTPPGKRKS
jgi:hypothetical protein